MSAFESFRAAHNNAPHLGMCLERDEVRSLLYAIDDLLGQLDLIGTELGVVKGERDQFRSELAFRTGRPPTIMGEVDFTPLEEWTAEDVIAVTPEQLVRIVREAGKP